ncbi:unnamed protein product [Cylindrotheca closterium]|uniref:Uncharacterized protein n=1 Tax=Cylindrotheca closterium TaxID=2856 RepID=A0AAD2FR52_9STRA|nr:unnamed protein product [Cylindrotheca closterium]
MKIIAKVTILLLHLGTGAAYRRRLKGESPSNAGLPTWSPSMKPTKVDLKVGKEKGVASNPGNDELPEVTSIAPADSKGDPKGSKDAQPSLRPTMLSIQPDPSLVLTLPPTKDPKGSTDPKGAPEDLGTLDESTGLEEPKGAPKGSGTVDDTDSDTMDDKEFESKGAPKGSGEVDDIGSDAADNTQFEPKGAPKGSGAVDDTESEPKGTPKGVDTEKEAGLAPKGAPKGSGTDEDTGADPKGAPKKGPDSNVPPTKKASAPVEVHMIGVKVASKHNGSAVVVSTTDDCSAAASNNMMAKKLAFSTPCSDPTVCGITGGTKKGAGKRNLKKGSCSKSSKSSSKKRHI